ncbi:HlyD family secretion family protein 1 [Achromobacter xylosoxidans A8]|uniref:HlyD family secretion family protein 1 n=1 Tax=Achromobacter xylosoxidans (strain A8) TaxID=762376 RepID=E3HUG7_ACHXA|nr:HlyD family efflux transporter periplasmic adaptor subunit [Achromobacter xylosoxidans]ADP13790.1 HlyD family secretion family protein 1 [Achromobacter xylosoxidans A8]
MLTTFSWAASNAVTLYRKKALAAQHSVGLGDIVLIRPVSFALVTAVLAGFVLTICLFLAFGSYTKRATVSGQLAPDTGLIKLYVPQAGIVLESRVQEGQHVAAGDVLYVVSGDQQSALGETQEAISGQIRQREESLRLARQKTVLLQQSEHDSQTAAIASLKAQLAAMDNQIAGQRARIKLAEDSANRYRGLMEKGYLSAEEADQKRAELLEQRNQLQALLRDRIGLATDLSNRQAALADLALRQQNQLAQLDRDMADIAVDLTRSEARRRILVSAPQAGFVTAVAAAAGQAVDNKRPLATIVPDGARLQAELLAPSRAVGFVAPGDRVLMRFAAYPYQTFGQQAGIVQTVTRSASPEWQLNEAAANNGVQEDMFRITVSLDAPARGPQGQTLALRPGMRLEADILQQTRRLYQWAFDPAQRLSGKL